MKHEITCLTKRPNFGITNIVIFAAKFQSIRIVSSSDDVPGIEMKSCRVHLCLLCLY
jgi:hypothetical protein